MNNRNKVSDEEFERIKKFVNRFSYLDLIAWRNQMIASGEINNRVFDLLNDEILRRAYEIDMNKSKEEGREK